MAADGCRAGAISSSRSPCSGASSAQAVGRARGPLRPGELRRPPELDDPVRFSGWLAEFYRLVYVKPPFAGPEAAVRYLGRYTHRVAISNQWLVGLEQWLERTRPDLPTVCFAFGSYFSVHTDVLHRIEVPADSLFVLSTHSPRTWESPYFGPVPLAAVRARAIPLWRFKP